MNSQRSWIIPTIVLCNIIVFCLWNFSGLVSQQFMADNFLVSWSALAEGRYQTLIGSVFSHNMLMHIFMNMFVLLSFGPIVEEFLGEFRFVVFYFVAGIVSSLSHAVVSNFIMHDPTIPALGASGAIAGVILLFSLLFPKEKILIFGILPIPALFGAIAFIGLDVWGLMAQAGGGGLPIGHGAHLGGAFVGIIYYLYLRAKGLRSPARRRF